MHLLIFAVCGPPGQLDFSTTKCMTVPPTSNLHPAVDPAHEVLPEAKSPTQSLLNRVSRQNPMKLWLLVARSNNGHR
jgi:hypothetical protein